MDLKEFDKVIRDCVGGMLKLGDAKGKQYTGKYHGKVDRLSQFKRIAEYREQDPEDALLGMVSKQWDWIVSTVENMREGGECPPYSEWTERTRDVQVYMALLEGLIIDREKGGK